MPNTPKKPNNKTLEIIDRCLEYFPKSGKLIWAVPTASTVKIGQLVGSINSKGYRTCNINRQSLKVHHICWYKFYGEWSGHQLDHINRIRSDNKIINLRKSTDIQNRHNSSANKTNITRQVGITFLDKWRKKKFHVDILREGVRLSSFHHTLEEAMEIRDEFFKQHSSNSSI